MTTKPRTLGEIAEDAASYLEASDVLRERAKNRILAALREAADVAAERAVANDREIRDDHWRKIVAAAEHRAEVADHAARQEEVMPDAGRRNNSQSVPLQDMTGGGASGENTPTEQQPLGHEFLRHAGSDKDCTFLTLCHVAGCGEPESAHRRKDMRTWPAGTDHQKGFVEKVDLTKPRTPDEIATSLLAKLGFGEDHMRVQLYAQSFIVRALREAADAALAGRCHCRLEGEPGRETIIHECQIHAEARLRYAGPRGFDPTPNEEES